MEKMEKEKKIKEKKSIFEQIEEQKKKLENLQKKKEDQIKKTVLSAFSFITENEEILIKFTNLCENLEFLTSIKDSILKEMEKEELKKLKEKKEESKKEESVEEKKESE